MSENPTVPFDFTHLREVIYERVLDVCTTYFDGRWFERSARLLTNDPATLAAELAGAISASVTRQLNADPGWPSHPQHPARAEFVVLSAQDIRSWGGALWYQPAAQIAQLRYEGQKTPGWRYDWVFRRLRAVGALVNSPKPNVRMEVPSGLVSVTLRRDGSATALFDDGSTTSVGQGEDPKDVLAESRIRLDKTDPHEGQYRDAVSFQAPKSRRRRSRKDSKP